MGNRFARTVKVASSDDKYKGEPLSAAAILKVMANNKNSIRHYLNTAIDYNYIPHYRVFEDRIMIQISVLEFEEGRTKVELSVVSMLQLDDKPARSYSSFSFLQNPQKYHITAALCLLQDKLGDLLATGGNSGEEAMKYQGAMTELQQLRRELRLDESRDARKRKYSPALVFFAGILLGASINYGAKLMPPIKAYDLGIVPFLLYLASMFFFSFVCAKVALK